MKTASKTKGITCIIISAFCFAFMNTFVRMAGDLPSVEKSFFRNFVALIFAAVMLLRTEENSGLIKESAVSSFESFFWDSRHIRKFLCYRPSCSCGRLNAE